MYNIQVLYAKSYMDRELYTLLIDGKYTYVYASSGMNPGRKGRIIPFALLATPERATLSGETPGYIYKECYFNGQWVNHRKEPHKLKPEIGELLSEIEQLVANHKPEYEPYDEIKTYADLLPIAKVINIELQAPVQDLILFDWNNDTLNTIKELTDEN